MSRNFVGRGIGYACRTVRDTVRYGLDTSFGTSATKASGEVLRVMSTIPASALLPHKESLLGLAQLTLNHRFEVLGSGWMEIVSQKRPVNFSNRSRSSALRGMIDSSYQPIDWHCDFKSGFQWSGRTWHRHIRSASASGADIKVPCELARMQHLPRLALAYGLSPEAAYLHEFRNQVLDFAASNPPRFGVNWSYARDAAIRVTNWLVAYDLFRSFGAEFDQEFRTEFNKLALDHGRYVRTHLERRGNARDNNYLAGIAGLIFLAAYLPRTPETEAWLRFSTGELIREVRHQFHPDGSNFESSTSYHRLSGEMVLFSTAILCGLPEPPAFPAWYHERLLNVAEFTRALRMPNGDVPQIGDNDSGRFLHLTPMYKKVAVREAREKYVSLCRYNAPDHAEYWDLDDLNHSHLLSAADGLFCPHAALTLECAAIRSMSHGNYLHPEAQNIPVNLEMTTPIEVDGHPKTVCNLEIGFSPVSHRAFTDFGVYIYSNDEFYLSIRCGGARGIHAHDDHLSIELHHRGQILFRDPGTYVYSPHAALRQRYCSLAAHAVPYPTDQGSKSRYFQDAGNSKCLSFNANLFLGVGDYGAGRRAYRKIQLSAGKLEITDFLSMASVPETLDTVPYSPGYGRLSSEFLCGGRSQTLGEAAA